MYVYDCIDHGSSCMVRKVKGAYMVLTKTNANEWAVVDDTKVVYKGTLHKCVVNMCRHYGLRKEEVEPTMTAALGKGHSALYFGINLSNFSRGFMYSTQESLDLTQKRNRLNW